jgi:hypothetical protein
MLYFSVFVLTLSGSRHFFFLWVSVDRDIGVWEGRCVRTTQCR